LAVHQNFTCWFTSSSLPSSASRGLIWRAGAVPAEEETHENEILEIRASCGYLGACFGDDSKRTGAMHVVEKGGETGKLE
jgi:hypothetical protein